MGTLTVPYIETSIGMNEYLWHNYFEDQNTDNGVLEKLINSQLFEVHSFSYKLLTHALCISWIYWNEEQTIWQNTLATLLNLVYTTMKKTTGVTLYFFLTTAYLRPFTNSDWAPSSPITENRSNWNISLQSGWSLT